MGDINKLSISLNKRQSELIIAALHEKRMSMYKFRNEQMSKLSDDCNEIREKFESIIEEFKILEGTMGVYNKMCEEE